MKNCALLISPAARESWLKKLLYMNLTAAFILIAALQVSGKTYSQERISVDFNHTALSRALKTVEQKSGYHFVFSNQVLSDKMKVTLKANDILVEDLLPELLANTGLIFKLMSDKLVAIRNADESYSGIVVKGRVTDSDGNPLANVSVSTDKGMGTATSELGEYSISAEENGSLTFSSVGYTAQTVKVDERTVVNVILAESSDKLSGVVVVGYGTQKKINLTGSVATVKGSVLTKRPVTNAAAMLEGMLPGVQVIQTTGQPGQGNVSIQVRGFGTYSGAGAGPLILVDGVPGDMENLNPSTIESVSVLKDAASASIYGSRGANGVILVTTKSGANNDGKIKVEYDYNYGIHTPTKLLDRVTSSPDYMRAWNTNIINSNYGVPIPSQEYTDAQIASYTNPSDKILYPSFDWQHFIIRAAPTQIHNLSISGGQQTHYNLSLGYTGENGTMDAFNYKRYNGQLNIVSNVSKKFKVGTNIGLKSGTTIADANGQQNYMITVLSMAPTVLPTLPGHPEFYSWRAFPFEFNNWNPYEQLKEHGTTTKDYALTSQIWTDLEIIKGLHWYAKAAANYATSQYSFFAGNSGYLRLYTDPSVLGYQYAPTSLTKTNTQDIYTNLYSYLNYEKKIGQHNLNLMVGYSNEEDNSNSIGAYRDNYASPSTPEIDAGSVDNSLSNNGSSSAWAIESGFARLSYNFKQKYLFETNVRYDGTSRLSPSTRWGAFPSVSAGWRFSEESFMQSSKSWLSDAKLRASWGRLGNQNIGLYPYQALLSLTGAYPFDNTSLSPGVAQTGLNNAFITWEKTASTDIGLDITLFNKLSFTLDAYKKRTSDILRSAQVTAVVGLTEPTINDGDMENTGIDFDISYSDRVKAGFFKDLNFGAGFILSAYKNKLVKFGVPQDNENSIDQEGLPWNSFYVLQATGIFQSPEEIASSPKQFGENTQPGTLKYKDVNQDGIIDDNDRVAMSKGVFPAFSYSFHFNASWKGFDLFGFFQGVAGSKELVTGWGLNPFIQGAPPTKEQYANAWTPENHSATTVQLGDPLSYNHPSTYFLKNNSYWRLKTLQIGYNLPKRWINKSGISGLRFYFGGDNLFTITRYPGLDPENTGSGRYVAYPQNKVVSFGCNVTF